MPARFGAKLRQLRERDGLTQTNLAQRLGLASHSHIAKLEAGQDRPSLDLVARTARLFEVTTDYLLRDKIPLEDIQPRVHKDAGHINAIALGKRLRTLREQKGLTQTTLAQQIGGGGQSGIGKVERGEKVPSLERLEQIADVFGVQIDTLLFG
jgi:transcriptional regulator with XRE-family HTH domain